MTVGIGRLIEVEMNGLEVDLWPAAPAYHCQKGWMAQRTRLQSITVFILTVESKLYKPRLLLQNQSVTQQTFCKNFGLNILVFIVLASL